MFLIANIIEILKLTLYCTVLYCTVLTRALSLTQHLLSTLILSLTSVPEGLTSGGADWVVVSRTEDLVSLTESDGGSGVA